MEINNKLKLIKKLYNNMKYHSYFVNPYYPKKIIDNISFIKKEWEKSIKYNPNIITHLYIHTPFCFDKCKFCKCRWGSIDFKIMQKYVDYIINYIEYFEDILRKIRFSWLFFWWWTASIYTETELERLLNAIFSRFNFTWEYFKEFELNPNSTSFNKIDILKKYWFNRFSFWIQSFNEKTLKKELRAYCSPERFKKIVSYSKKVGIEVINADLILWLNSENIDDFSISLKYMMDCRPDMITLHTLQYKQETSSLYTTDYEFYNKMKEIYEYLINNLVKKSDYEVVSYDIDSVVILKLKWVNINSKKIYKEQEPKVESLFWVWFGSYSQIYWRWKYYILHGNYDISKTRFEFEILTHKDEFNIMLIRSIEEWIIDTSVFNKEFKINFFEKYKDIIDLLKKEKIITISWNKIIFISNDIEQIHYWLSFFDLKFILQQSIYKKLWWIRNL